MAWWRDGVLYQIYPRSFADSNGDGIGDIRGIVGRLDHLAWLGVDGIWLNPVMPSPNADWGYDVADYCAVHPDLGTLDDLDLLIAEAGSRGIKVILDLVPNHSSDQHPWFVDSRSSRSARHRDWYVWADPKPAGSPPNNWRSFFGGGAWTFDEPTGQCYLHQFASEQPDLNWWNDEVRSAFDDIHRFWLDRGVAGWRIDVCHLVVKDRELRDNPTRVGPNGREIQDLVYQTDRPEVHDVIRRWREVAGSYDPPRMLFGETYVLDVERIAAYYGTGDELHLALNVPFIHSPFEAERLRAVVERTEEVLPEVAWPIWTGSNHDARRLMTRWCRDDPARARLALVMLLTLRGTPLLYYGDEIGMPDNDHIPPEAVKDTATRRRRSHRGYDRARAL